MGYLSNQARTLLENAGIPEWLIAYADHSQITSNNIDAFHQKYGSDGKIIL